MAAQLRVFVSHASEDSAFCQAMVDALVGAGADVWYDERNLGSGVLRREIMRELSARPVFLVVLSKAAFASGWVQDECEWAYNLYRRKPERLILPVVGAPYDPDDFDTLLYIESMKRIEASGNQPYPTDEAVRHLMRALALTSAGETPVSTAPQPTESVDDLLTRGRALAAQKKFAEALPLFERAAQLAPDSIDAWVNLCYILGELKRWQDALTACNRALALDDEEAWIWGIKGLVLRKQGHTDEAIAAYDRALVIDANNADVWNNKGYALFTSQRYDEAMAAADRALALNPDSGTCWDTKGQILNAQGRYQDALLCLDRAIRLDSNYAEAWNSRATALRGLGRHAEAAEAEKRARELGW